MCSRAWGDYDYFCVQWPVVSQTQALACVHKQPHTHECMYTNASARTRTHANKLTHIHALYSHNDGFDFGSGAAWICGACARANLLLLELKGHHPRYKVMMG